MAALTDLIIDLWSNLSHKSSVGDTQTVPGDSLVPSWVPVEQTRRLNAYKVLAAYRANSARHFLVDDDTAVDADRHDGHREYGDALLIQDRIVAGVLGQDWSIVVDGANNDLPDEPDLPDKPDDPGPDADPLQRRIFASRMARWEVDAAAAVDAWEQDWADQPALQERQDKLRGWAERVQLDARIVEAEGDAVGLGDSVYVLWPQAGDWPRVQTFDPGVYFPVLDDDSDEDFPTKVHFAWEFTVREGNEIKRFVRRITFELVAVTVTKVLVDARGVAVWQGPDGAAAPVPVLADREGVDENGNVWRQYPWDLDVDGSPLVDTVGGLEVERRSYRTCLYSDATWEWSALNGRKADDFDESKATFRVLQDGTVARRMDLRCDFLPVVHVPNTPTGREHFGQSSLGPVAQLFDDLGQNDTDVMISSRYSSGPVMGLSGARMPAPDLDRFGRPVAPEVFPGRVFELGENGKMDVLNLSQGLDRLMALNERLQDRLLVSGRVPAEMVGRVDSSAAVSGFALALALAPFGQLVGVLRMARDPKMRLLLRFAQRLAQVQGVLPVGPSMDARVEYGPFMPGDVAGEMTFVAAGLAAHAISTQTAVDRLVSAGLEVDDARAEVDRIRREDTPAAVDIGNATGSGELAAEALGLELPPSGPGPLPPIGLPPRPGQAPPPVDPNTPPVDPNTPPPVG